MAEHIVTESKGYIAPARDALAAYNPNSSSYPGGDDSCAIGKVSDGRLFSFTPARWMADEIVDSRVVIILGGKNQRKTTLAMHIAAAMASGRSSDGSPMRIYADEIRKKGKGAEYDPLAEFFDSKPVRLTDKLNPFDEAFNFTFSQHETTALDLVKSGKNGVEATTREEYHLRVALYIMFKTYGHIRGIETLAKILETLSDDDIDMYQRETLDAAIRRLADEKTEEEAEEARFQIDQLLARSKPANSPKPLGVEVESSESRTTASQGAQELSEIITRILFGDFDERFGGMKSFASMMKQRAVIFDMSGMNDRTMAFIQAFLWRLKLEAHRKDDQGFIFQLQIHDENYRLWNDPTFAREMSDYLKQIRSYETTLVMISHRMRDYYSVGSPGSTERQRATNMFGDVPIWFIGKLPMRDARDVVEYHGWDESWIDAISSLSKGVFVAKIGTWPPFTVDTNALTTEQILEISYSNMANDALLA